LYFRRIK
jgi:hypothetical protein